MQPGDLKPPFDTIAWYLPIWGLVVAHVVIAALRGRARRMAATFLPLLVGVAMWWVSPALVVASGNWLSGLGKMVLFGSGYLLIALYYIALLATAIGMWLRRNEQLRAAAAGNVDAGEDPGWGGLVAEERARSDARRGD